jgi:hypothetical protein
MLSMSMKSRWCSSGQERNCVIGSMLQLHKVLQHFRVRHVQHDRATYKT